MNSIHGIIHDLADEETVIGGCTTAGEVIITLQSLVEEKERLRRLSKGWLEEKKTLNDKLKKIEQIVKQVESMHPEVAIGDREGIRKIREVLADFEKRGDLDGSN